MENVFIELSKVWQKLLLTLSDNVTRLLSVVLGQFYLILSTFTPYKKILLRVIHQQDIKQLYLSWSGRTNQHNNYLVTFQA